MSRSAALTRKTGETQIDVKINLDGQGQVKSDTGIAFFDHMLTLLSVHSLVDLDVKAVGDIAVDDHHTVEDVGICLGQALKEALGDRKSIRRYGEASIPMDESLVRVCLDFSGRSYLVFCADMPSEKVGGLSTENVREFFQALANHSGMTLHVDLLRGFNSHHIIEAVFKAFARALKTAVEKDPRLDGIPSSKGVL